MTSEQDYVSGSLGAWEYGVLDCVFAVDHDQTLRWKSGRSFFVFGASEIVRASRQAVLEMVSVFVQEVCGSEISTHWWRLSRLSRRRRYTRTLSAIAFEKTLLRRPVYASDSKIHCAHAPACCECVSLSIQSDLSRSEYSCVLLCLWLRRSSLCNLGGKLRVGKLSGT